MGSIHARHPGLWVATSAHPGFPQLKAPLEVEVAVVGGGITGLTTALLLQTGGVRVAVLEAGEIGAGSTGYSTGKLTALHGLIHADLRARIGEEAARTYAAANQAAIEQVAALVRGHGIDCAFERRSAYTYTREPARVSLIEDEVDTLERLGLPVAFTRETGLPFSVEAAVRLDEQAQFHPRRYCLGLADALVHGGGQVFEHTRVHAVEETEGACILDTGAARVRADRAVLATLLPFIEAGRFYKKTSPSRSYLLAVRADTPPLDGMYISADAPLRSLRQSGDVLLVGGAPHAVGHEPDTPAHYGALEAWTREHFMVNEVTHRWSAQDYMPAARVPFVGRPEPAASGRVLVATGFQKWGLSLGTAAAMMLHALALGRRHDWLDLFDAARRDYPAAPGRGHGHGGGASAPESVAALGPGQGAVFDRGEEKIAVFRGEDGGLHALSALCPHHGCPVAFNPAEQSWDCHCHGSRFATDGRVLDGPAVDDLPRREPPS